MASSPQDTGLAEIYDAPHFEARQLAYDLLVLFKQEPSEFNVQALLLTATFFFVVLLSKLLRIMIFRVKQSAGGQSKGRQQKQKDKGRDEKEKKAAELEASKERARLQGQTGRNAFGGILKQKAKRGKAAEQAALNRPRSAWLGKKEFICTERKANLLLKPRMRCWFADCCYRDGKDHLRRYTHPGEADWNDGVCKIQVGEATQQAVKDTARAFTKAGGRGDFAPMGKAARFMKDYSGLPKCFLEKLSTGLGFGFGMTGQIRREQFAVAMLAVDSVQAALNSGDVTVADIEFEGVQIQPRKSWVDSPEVKAAEEAQKLKERKQKARRGIPQVSETQGVRLPDFFNTGHPKLVVETDNLAESASCNSITATPAAPASKSTDRSEDNGGRRVGSRLPPDLRAACMAMSVEELQAKVEEEERLLQRDRAELLVREGFF